MLIDVFAGKNRVYMIDRDNVIYSVPKARFPRIDNPGQNICKTLLDGVSITHCDHCLCVVVTLVVAVVLMVKLAVVVYSYWY